MLRLLAIFSLLASLLTGVVAAEKPVYTIYTGSQRGTYIRFGEDIARACPQFQVQVVSSDGSLDNLNSLIQPPIFRAGHRFAFVQNDVLTSVLASEPIARTIIQPMIIMYPEDINFLVYRGSNINNIRDLNGKRVAIGTPGSGVWFTANAIRNQLSLTWTPVERSPEESILGVLVGDIDAMIMVGGSPIRMFSDMGAYVKDRVKLLNVNEPRLTKYSQATIPSGTYVWQDTNIELPQTRSMLVAAADVPTPAVDALLKCISDNLSELRRWGHPKWSLVQPQKPLKPLKPK